MLRGPEHGIAPGSGPRALLRFFRCCTSGCIVQCRGECVGAEEPDTVESPPGPIQPLRLPRPHPAVLVPGRESLEPRRNAEALVSIQCQNLRPRRLRSRLPRRTLPPHRPIQLHQRLPQPQQNRVFLLLPAGKQGRDPLSEGVLTVQIREMVRGHKNGSPDIARHNLPSCCGVRG
jgi:hypothetical protein